LQDLDFASIFISFIVLLFSLTVLKWRTRGRRIAWAIRRRGCLAASR
jgi:hypothetical protein